LDFHLHTYYSACGKRDMAPARVAAGFRAAGYEAIGFTDHLHPWIDPAIFDRLRHDLEQSRDQIHGLDCYVGCEAEVIAPGTVTLDAKTAETLDFAIISASHFHLDHVSRPGDPSPAGVAAHYLRFFVDAIRCPGASAIAHPFIANRDALGPVAEILPYVDQNGLRAALQEAAGRGVAVELSPKALSSSNVDVLLDFYQLARECGVRFLIGSDAHSTERIASTSRLETLISALTLTDEDIWRPAVPPR
jgi:histidinol phosphatase-like PHP family hydrolase